MKTIGIIGGLGPETTAEFYLEILLNAARLGHRARPRILIESIPMDLEVEQEFITSNKHHKEYIDLLIYAAKALEVAGADFIVIPCNSVHIFIDAVRKAVSIPILSIVEETKKVASEIANSDIGLLATSTTIKNNIYGGVTTADGDALCYLKAEEQELLDELILKLVNNRHNKNDKKELVKLTRTFAKRRKLNVIVLACTDLQIAIKDIKGIKVIDSMSILAQSTVTCCVSN